MEEHRESMLTDDMFKLPSLGEVPWLILTHENDESESELENQTEDESDLEDQSEDESELEYQTEDESVLKNQTEDESELENQTFCLMNNKSYTKTIVELQGKSILASNQGWLILQERVNPSKYSLWNPVTRQCLVLPELLDPPEEEEQPCTCIFTSAPYGNDQCVVLLFYRGFVFSCRLTMSGDGCSWVKQSLEHDGQSVLIWEAAAINGDIYAYAYIYNDDQINTVVAHIKVRDTNLILFEPIKEIKIPYQSMIKYKTCHQSRDYLVEVCGVLYAVYVIMRQLHEMDDYDIVKIYVWRLDLSEMKWIQVESLGDRAFLLGHNCCTWCWADNSCSGIERDCIYMTRPGSQTVHQYRLQDDSYIFLSPYSNLLQTWNNPIWFMPHNPTRLTPEKLLTENIKDSENIKHVEELEETKMAIPASSSICRLSSDMLISITNYLNLIDYMNLRTTCKILRFSIPSPQGSSNSSHPLFMSLKNTKGGICELWDPCQNICHKVVTHHYSPDLLSTIEFCKDGWLLLRIEGDSLLCFNPFNRESYKYPSDGKKVNVSSLAFSTCPTSPDCLTVGIEAYSNRVRIVYFQAGNEQWDYDYIKVDPDEAIEFQSNFNSSPKYLDGAFYFLGVEGNLGVLEMLDGEWSWWVYEGPILENISLNSCYLVELDGELISVFIEKDGRRVQVFKFDTYDEDWVALHDLGDYMLFVSQASSFSARVSTKDSNMRNRIYLPKRIHDEMVFYSLDTGMYHTSSSQLQSKDFYGMRSQSFCCWL